MKGRVIFKATADGIALESQISEATPVDLLTLSVVMQKVAADLTAQVAKGMLKSPILTPEPSRIVTP